MLSYHLEYFHKGEWRKLGFLFLTRKAALKAARRAMQINGLPFRVGHHIPGAH